MSFIPSPEVIAGSVYLNAIPIDALPDMFCVEGGHDVEKPGGLVERYTAGVLKTIEDLREENLTIEHVLALNGAVDPFLFTVDAIVKRIEWMKEQGKDPQLWTNYLDHLFEQSDDNSFNWIVTAQKEPDNTFERNKPYTFSSMPRGAESTIFFEDMIDEGKSLFALLMRGRYEYDLFDTYGNDRNSRLVFIKQFFDRVQEFRMFWKAMSHKEADPGTIEVDGQEISIEQYLGLLTDERLSSAYLVPHLPNGKLPWVEGGIGLNQGGKSLEDIAVMSDVEFLEYTQLNSAQRGFKHVIHQGEFGTNGEGRLTTDAQRLEYYRNNQVSLEQNALFKARVGAVNEISPLRLRYLLEVARYRKLRQNDEAVATVLGEIARILGKNDPYEVSQADIMMFYLRGLKTNLQQAGYIQAA